MFRRLLNCYFSPITKRIDEMLEVIQDLRREVAEAKDAQASAVVLIKGLQAQIADLAQQATDLTQLKADLAALAQDLSDSTDALADAVTAPPSEAGESEAGEGESGGETAPSDDHTVEVETEEQP